MNSLLTKNLTSVKDFTQIFLQSAIEIGNDNLHEYNFSESYLVLNYNTICSRSGLSSYQIFIATNEAIKYNLITLPDSIEGHINLNIKNVLELLLADSSEDSNVDRDVIEQIKSFQNQLDSDKRL